MEQIEPPESTENPEIWCPGCDRLIPTSDQTLVIEFTPQTWNLLPTGSLDTGTAIDVFMDYEHLTCGTSVRIVSNAGWVEELGEYVASPRNAFIEVTIRGEYQTEDPADPDASEALKRISPFSSSVEAEPAKWGPTWMLLLEMYQEALKLLKERLGDESA